MNTETTEAIVEVLNKNKSKRPGSKWAKGKARPAAWWLTEKKEPTKILKKSTKDPYEKLREATVIMNVRVGGNSIGMTFDDREVRTWLKESKYQGTRTVTNVNYTIPKGL